ncbi:MAG: EAL domain-containing protein [Planctomycetota bacterium]|nr:EAL domain-containing protein [Planctomycetota bacterium]
MHIDPTIILATPQESVHSKLTEALETAGFQVHLARDLEECTRRVRQNQPWFLVVDSQWVGDCTGGVSRDLSHLIEASQGRCMVLYDPTQEFGFAEARKAGVAEFVAYPAPADLVVTLIPSLLRATPPVQAKAESTQPGTFMALDAFESHLEDCIAKARTQDEKVAVLCVSMLAPFGAKDAPDTADKVKRNGLETWFSETLNSHLSGFLKIHSNLGFVPQNLRWAWASPEKALLIVPDLKRIQDVAKIGAAVIEAIGEAPAGMQMEYMTSVFTGVAVCPGDASTGPALVEKAIVAGNRALGEGSMSLTFHTDSMGQWAFERLTLEESLHGALLNNEFRVHYQPRLDAQTREILGVEALVRWVHPQLGMVSPVQFIPLAEETGLIEPIGEWVLREACRQNQAWRDAGFDPIRVSVNLSPIQFRNTALPEVVEKALKDSKLDTNGLELEVTESMLMNNPDDTIRTLKCFKEMGLKISIDDFGTGYSSLSYLKQFPIDSLKVDRSFIQNVTTNPDDAAITTAVILMGHSLKLNVVAEGVETESQLAFLQVLQCNEVQGFLFSPPVPADRMEAMLSREDAKQLD